MFGGSSNSSPIYFQTANGNAVAVYSQGTPMGGATLGKYSDKAFCIHFWRDSSGSFIEDILLKGHSAYTAGTVNITTLSQTSSLGWFSPTTYVSFYLGEMLLYSGNLTDAEREQNRSEIIAEYTLRPPVFFTSQFGSDSNVGRFQSTSFKTLQALLAYLGSSYGAWSVNCNGNDETTTANVTIGSANSMQDPVTVVNWPRPAITGLTGTFTTGSRIVTNVSGATLDNRSHSVRYMVAPDGRQYKIAICQATDALTLGVPYLGTTVTDTFSINKDEHSWIKDELNTYDGVDSAGTWDAAGIQIPRVLLNASSRSSAFTFSCSITGS